MDLNEIMPKAGIEIDFNGGNFGVSIQGRDADEIIFIYQYAGEFRRVLWKNKSLESLLDCNFINIECVSKVTDWTIADSLNIIYKRSEITLTMDEVKKRLGVKHLIIKD